VSSVLIGGIGNVLLGDDGIGPFVIRMFESHFQLGQNIEVADLGTPSLDLTHRIAERHALILVDSVTGDDPPGTVVLYRKEDILKTAPAERLDPHSPALSECLMASEMLGSGPEHVLLVGVVGAHYEPGSPLSDEVQESVGKVISEVLCELERLGYDFEERETPADPEIWWAEVSSAPVVAAGA
jgi:hydrogenase maturation protease